MPALKVAPASCLLAMAGLVLTAGPLPAQQSLAERLAGIEFTQLSTAPGYSEGPAWVKGSVYFCSGGLQRAGDNGQPELWLDIKPAGTVLKGDGKLLICDNHHKALLQLSLDGDLDVIAERFDGQPLNSLNDLTIDAAGHIYWTDPSGSSAKNPVGNVFRVTPDGTVTRVATGLAFPNGIEVDPASRFLYVIESQSRKILRYPLPEDGGQPGPKETFYDLGGSGGDGCTFDAAGNLWVADFHRPETEHGRITILSPEGKRLAQLDVPAKVVSNITFGGENHDEIFCTTGTPPGVFTAKVGVRGFAGHPGKQMKAVRSLPVPPASRVSRVHPRRFGVPGGEAGTRGWYIWEKYDPATGLAEVRHESRGERYTTRVLPWVSTYRHLAYGGSPQDLLPGERVNLFFSRDQENRRAHLAHFQDEICQMKGHGHYWRVESVAEDKAGFTARVMAGNRPFGENSTTFRLAKDCRVLRDGKSASSPQLEPGGKLYLTWCHEGDERVVHVLADAASLPVLKQAEEQRIAQRVDREGLSGQVEVVNGQTVRFLIFSRHWAQANSLKPGRTLVLRPSMTEASAAVADSPAAPQPAPAVAAELVSRKNLGRYGSGATEAFLRLNSNEDAATVSNWPPGRIVRVLLQEK